MAVRPIDGEELLSITRLLDTDVVRQSKTASWLLDQVLHDIQAMPTLTPPNEWVTLEQLRASPHGKIKDSTLQSICNRANEIACRPPEGEKL